MTYRKSAAMYTHTHTVGKIFHHLHTLDTHTHTHTVGNGGAAAEAALKYWFTFDSLYIFPFGVYSIVIAVD